MQARKAQPWKLTIHTKAKNFHLKLKANKITFLPFSKISQFSIKFKLNHFFINVKSEPNSSFKSRFLKLLRKLRARGAKKSVAANKTFRNKVGESKVARHLALFNRSISQKDGHGVLKFGSRMVMCLVCQVYFGLTRKKYSRMLLLTVAIFISSAMLPQFTKCYFSKAKITMPLLEFIAKFFEQNYSIRL